MIDLKFIKINRFKFLSLIQIRRILILLILVSFFLSEAVHSMFSDDLEEASFKISRTSQIDLEEQKNDLQTTPAKKSILAYLPEWIPIAGIQFLGLSQSIYVKWALSQTSAMDMAVAELKAPSQDFFYMVGIAPLYGVEDLIAYERAQLNAAREKCDHLAIRLHSDNMGEIYRTANTLGLLTSLPVIIGMRHLAPSMIRLGYNSELYDQVDNFYKYYSLCVPFLNFSFIAENFAIAEGNVKNAFFMGGVTLLLCSMDYAFIYGPLRFKNIFTGLAISEFTKSLIYSSCYLIMLNKKESYRRYGLFGISYKKEMLLKIVRRSTPLLFQAFFGVLKPMIYMQFILPDDQNLLAANSLFSQITLPSQLFIKAIGKWLNIELKGPSSSQNSQTVLKLGNRAILHAQIVVALLAGVTYFYPDSVASIFIDTRNPANLKLMKLFSSVVSLQLTDLVVSSLGNITSWAMRGIGQVKRAAYSEFLSSYLISLPLTYYLVNKCEYGLMGAVLGSLAGNIINTSYLQYSWWSENLGWDFTSSIKRYVWGSVEQPTIFRRIITKIFYRTNVNKM